MWYKQYYISKTGSSNTLIIMPKLYITIKNWKYGFLSWIPQKKNMHLLYFYLAWMTHRCDRTWPAFWLSCAHWLSYAHYLLECPSNLRMMHSFTWAVHPDHASTWSMHSSVGVMVKLMVRDTYRMSEMENKVQSTGIMFGHTMNTAPFTGEFRANQWSLLVTIFFRLTYLSYLLV